MSQEAEDKQRFHLRRLPRFYLAATFSLWESWRGSAKTTHPLKVWVFLLLWISLIFQACLLDCFYYQEFKSRSAVDEEIRQEETSDARPKYFFYSCVCYVWPAKLNTKMGPGRSEVLSCISGFWFRGNSCNSLSQIHNTNAIK